MISKIYLKKKTTDHKLYNKFVIDKLGGSLVF